MCGRFTQTMTWRELVAIYRIQDQSDIPNLEARYNVAPTQKITAVRLSAGVRRVDMLRWGLIPGWSKDLKIGYSTINARAEIVAEKPAFKAAFKARRCFIPANGYYEWIGTKGSKQPWYFTAADGGLLTFAGLWGKSVRQG